jgi:hypothetical protein
LQTSHNQTRTLQPTYDAQALVASKIVEMIFKYLKAKNLFGNLIKSLENKF